MMVCFLSPGLILTMSCMIVFLCIHSALFYCLNVANGLRTVVVDYSLALILTFQRKILIYILFVVSEN